MFGFLRGREPHLTADRIKLQKELFSFNKLSSLGFPHHPTCLAYDDVLNIFAIGQRNGTFRIYGKPGFELIGKHENDVELRKIFFINGRGQLITLTDDHCICLWEINESNNECVLEKKAENKQFIKDNREGNIKDITTIFLDINNNILFIGIKNGNIYALNLGNLSETDIIIYQDIVLQTLNNDEHKRVNPGEVEVIVTQPNNFDNLLIGYNKGLIVLWSLKYNKSLKSFFVNQGLESLHWNNDGERFVSSHNDGSYIVWTMNNDNIEKDSDATASSKLIPYGPFPCKPITKILWKQLSNGQDLFIFSGGMPRSEHGDKNTVSVIQGSVESGKHQALDLTKVIDFFVIERKNNENEQLLKPVSLIILSQEELIAIDLEHDEWLPYRLPYLWSIHCSGITCSQFVRNISEKVYQEIITASKNSKDNEKYSPKEWPINGGKVIETNPVKTNDILITGHEDGSARFWSIGSVSLYLLCSVNTEKLFIPFDDGIAAIDDDIPIEAHDEDEDEDFEWPPFRKIGIFDPHSDDVRFAVRKICFCPNSGLLVIGGAAGQIVIFEIKQDVNEIRLSIITGTIISNSDSFTWQGCRMLSPTNGVIKFEPGFQPKTVLQISPPASISTMILNTDWALLSAGTAFGFVLHDLIQSRVIFTKSTIKITESSETVSGGDAMISRRKSIKKSLRESFRRLRKGRSQREKKTTSPNTSPVKDGRVNRGEIEIVQLEKRIVERQVEARSPEEGSIVRCLYFVRTCITSHNVQSCTLWVGLNSGLVYVYALGLPITEKRSTDNVTCVLGKELQLKHKAPVIFMQVLDAAYNPVPVNSEKSSSSSRPTSPSHSSHSVSQNKVLICSEEQFKLFTLPALKPSCKFKLTAHEGSRARKINVGKFFSKNDERYSENCLMCLSNQGDISTYTLHDLRKQASNQCTKREDINGISSLIFTGDYEGLYLQSPSEFRSFSLSARTNKRAICSLTVDLCLRKTTARKTETVEVPKEKKVEQVDPTPTSSTDLLEETRDETEPLSVESPVTEPSSTHESAIDDNLLSSDSGVEMNTETIDETRSTMTANNIKTVTKKTEANCNTTSTTLNGTAENGELTISSLGEYSRLTNETSMDITIDSVKDHLGNMSITSATGNSLIVTSPTSNSSTTPVLNSHED